MTTSVVVVSWRPHQWLEPCLTSVLDQADDVVVVDNGSPGDFGAETAERLGARAVRLGRNRGFPGGVNAGLAAARGDVVALLNDDAMAEPGWLASAAGVLEDPTVGAVAPKLLLADRYARLSFPDEPFRIEGDGRSFGRALRGVTVGGKDVLGGVLGAVHRLESEVTEGRPTAWRWTAGPEAIFVPLLDGAHPEDLRVDGQEVAVEAVVDLLNNAGSYLSQEGHGGDFGFETPDSEAFSVAADRFAACGAAMVARAETFRRLGGFADSFFAYYEDTDWCWRAQLAGLRIRYEPAGVVRHVRGVSTGGAGDLRVQFLAARNRLHCLARNAPLDLLRWQLRRSREPGQPDGLVRALVGRVPMGLAERRRLSRRWSRRPAEVFGQWGGTGETWAG